MKLSDLISYAREQSRIAQSDYFHPSYARPDEIKAWRRDRSRRDRSRREVMRAFPGRVRNAASETLVPGRYAGGRLIISDNGSFDYISGQYAPVEIWPAVFDYLTITNACEG